jgi:hypothetical protein
MTKRLKKYELQTFVYSIICITERENQEDDWRDILLVLYNVETIFAAFTSQIRTVMSSESETIRFPSSENATDLT